AYHYMLLFFFFSSRRLHTRFSRDWSSDVCSSDLDDRNACGCLPTGAGQPASSSGPVPGRHWQPAPASARRRSPDARSPQHPPDPVRTGSRAAGTRADADAESSGGPQNRKSTPTETMSPSKVALGSPRNSRRAIASRESAPPRTKAPLLSLAVSTRRYSPLTTTDGLRR